MNKPNSPTLSFTCDFDDRTRAEVELKGYFEHAIACLPDGRKVKLYFWDPVRLAQDLETEQRLGRACIAEPCLVVVPRVTVQYMQAAIEELYRNGYFDRLLTVIY